MQRPLRQEWSQKQAAEGAVGRGRGRWQGADLWQFAGPSMEAVFNLDENGSRWKV